MNNKNNIKTMLLKLDGDLHKQLKINAIKEGVTLQDYVNKLLIKNRNNIN